MTDAVGQVVPNGADAPPPDPDAAKYEALRQELGLEEAKPEPETEPEATPAAEPEPQHVPRAEHENVQKALREAREQAQAAKAEKVAILDLIERSRRQAEPKKDEPPKIPSEQEDPIGHFKALYAQQQAKIEALERGGQQSTEQIQAQLQAQQAHSIAVASEAEIVKSKPDYWDACKHLETMRAAQLNAMFPDSSPHVAAYAQSQGFNSVQEMKIAALENDRRAVLMHAIGMGTSPAELYYSLATQAGYQVKPNGKAGDADKAKAQIEAARRGQKAALTISGGSGRKTTQDMSLSELNALKHEDPDAYEKAWDELKRSGRLG